MPEQAADADDRDREHRDLDHGVEAPKVGEDDGDHVSAVGQRRERDLAVGVRLTEGRT
jgi:hypothetical protein